MNKKIVIAGGTGFVGKFLEEKFKGLGYEVKIISRGPGHINWDNISDIIRSLEDSEMLINLAGRSVDCRYNKKNRQEIYDSRIKTTRILGEAILQCKNPPELWVNSGTATIYRYSKDKPMTEAAGEIGTGFSVHVATNWEKTLFDFNLPHTRQVALRMAIVLGKGGGAIKPLSNLVRFGLGGKQGKGDQMFSWIHIEDVFNIIIYLQQQKELTGAFNVSAPDPVTNKTLMRSIRKIMKVKFGLPSPTWLLEIGAVIIRTETELILKSRWVVPERLLRSGFNFKYPTIDTALKSIL